MKVKKTSRKLNWAIQQLLGDAVQDLPILLSECVFPLISAPDCHVTYNTGGGMYYLLRIFS